MAEKHDELVSRFRIKLIRKGYKIDKRSPFVDYRPDISASKNNEKIFVEVEINQTLYSDHTSGQLEIMYRYVRKNKNYKGLLIVPKSAQKEAEFLVDSIFGDDKIRIVGL
jgi:hypothetical protein